MQLQWCEQCRCVNGAHMSLLCFVRPSCGLSHFPAYLAAAHPHHEAQHCHLLEWRSGLAHQCRLTCCDADSRPLEG